MKKIFKLLAVTALLAGLGACQNVEPEDLYSTDPVAPEMYAHNDILLTTGTTAEDVVFAWSAYRNLSKGLPYEFCMEHNGTVVTIYNGTDTYYKTDKDAFRTLVLGSFNDLPENDTFALTFYVSVSEAGEAYVSNSVTVNVYAYGDGVASEVSLVAETLELDPTDPTAEVKLITWTPARLVYGEEVTYSVYLRLADTDPVPASLGRRALDTDYLLGEGITETSFSISVDELNEAIVAAGGKEAAEVPVKFVVDAVCASLPGGVEATSAAMTVTTYVTTFPEVLYLPGSHQDWDPASAPTLALSGTIKGYYEGIVDLTTEDGSDAQFKFCIQPDWGGDFGGAVVVTTKDAYTSAVGTVGASDDIVVPSGKYLIKLNKKLNTLEMVTIKSVGVIGTAVGGWSDEITMDWNEETNVFTTTVEALSAGEYKFRLNNDWDYSIDDSYGVNGGGANFQNSAEGNYKIQLDMSKHPYSVKFINLSFPESVYLPGSHNGWKWTTILAGDGEGHYQGFTNVGGEWGFKVTSGPGWSGDGYDEWGLDAGSDGSFTIKTGGGNIMEGSEVTYARVTVDLTSMSLTVDPVTEVEVVGSFTDWGTNEDYLMKYSSETDSWKIEGAAIPAGGQWKFRMNRDWAINVGGALDNLVQDGGNITDTDPGVYTIELFLGSAPFHATLTKTGELDGPAYSTKLIVAGNYSGHSWSASDDPALLGTGDGKFKGPLTMMGSGIEFKFVHNGSWIGQTATDGLSWTLGDGGNVSIAAGTYFFTVDLTANTASAFAITKVGLIGDFNTWSDDVEMTFNESALTYSGTITTTAANQGFKVRFNGDWGYSLGGNINELTSLDGANINIEAAGTYTITLDMAHATPSLTIVAAQ